jgi:hypothetical protein
MNDKSKKFIEKIRNMKLVKVTVIYAVIYAFLVTIGFNSAFRRHSIAVPSVLYAVIAVLSCVCIYFFLELAFAVTVKLRERFRREEATGFAAWLSSWTGVLVRFLVILGCCLVVFLNRYPGTIIDDAGTQLKEAVNMSGYENFNPAIHTFVITFFVQIGMKIKDVMLGIALYTLFQLMLYSVVATYVLILIDKVKTGAVWKILGTLFFIFPTYLMYATAVSKDTFFAIMMLLTLCYIADIFISNKPMSVKRQCVLAFLVLVTSMSRNSGWSAILVGGICMIIYYRNRKMQISKLGGAESQNCCKNRDGRSVACCGDNMRCLSDNRN